MGHELLPIDDLVKGEIKKLVLDRSWVELKAMKDNVIATAVKDEPLNTWGIKIHSVTLTTIAKVKSIRVIR